MLGRGNSKLLLAFDSLSEAIWREKSRQREVLKAVFVLLVGKDGVDGEAFEEVLHSIEEIHQVIEANFRLHNHDAVSIGTDDVSYRDEDWEVCVGDQPVCLVTFLLRDHCYERPARHTDVAGVDPHVVYLDKQLENRSEVVNILSEEAESEAVEVFLVEPVLLDEPFNISFIA